MDFNKKFKQKIDLPHQENFEEAVLGLVSSQPK